MSLLGFMYYSKEQLAIQGVEKGAGHGSRSEGRVVEVKNLCFFVNFVLAHFAAGHGELGAARRAQVSVREVALDLFFFKKNKQEEAQVA
jgi:hypothetical protein